MFLSFSRDTFRKVFELSCWINLIFCAYGGAQIGNTMGTFSDNRGFLTFLGFILGVGVGLLTNILCGGLIATLLNIDENLRLLREKQVPNVGNVSTPVLSQNERQPTVVPEGVVAQAKCGNCSKMLSCELTLGKNYFDENSCCEKHEFFRG